MSTNPIIHLRDLSFAFGPSWAIQGIHLDIVPGEFVFLTGPSGAGKTTLLRLLHGSLPIQKGTALIAGYNLQTLPPKRLHLLRRDVTVVFQDFMVLPQRSVRENIALPLVIRNLPRDQIHRRVNAVLRGLQLESKGQAICGRLSGGEQQRVAIARSIVVNPKVLLADEPTGNVDPEASMRLLDILDRFNAHGTTIILATHDQHLLQANVQSRVLHLDQGQLQGVSYAASPSGI
ncbi:MAG: ATP-binding cassette domain-containing protein [Desulfovermiculus sp.]